MRSYMRGLDFGEFPGCVSVMLCTPQILPALPFAAGNLSVHGRAALLSVNAVSEVPVRARWLRPYLVGGVGIAEVRREQRFENLPLRLTGTSTGPLLTIGGGVEFLLWRKVGVGVDLRYQRVFEEMQFGRSDMDEDLSLTRLGSSVSYRF